MTTKYLMDEVHDLIKNLVGEKVLNLFKYNINKQLSEEEEDIFPYILLKLNPVICSGIKVGTNIGITVIVAIKNENLDISKGYEDVISIIEKIAYRFCENNIIKHFTLDKDMKWEVYSDEDTYPYFFGAIEMVFTGCSVVRNIGGDEFS